MHALDPDVAVLDVRLPDGNGVEVCRDIRSLHPRTACLMLTSFTDDEALFQAIMAGASGYVLKQVRGTDLVGPSVGSRQARPSSIRVTARVLERSAAGPRGRAPRPPHRARANVLDLLAEGFTNRQIGERMFLAEKTIKNYVSNCSPRWA